MPAKPYGLNAGALLLALLALTVILVSASRTQAQSQPEPDYVIGPQDVLSIAVWDQPDLTGKFAVETDGTFTFPLVGRIKAGGLTLKGLEAEMVKRLKDGYFVNPQVTVAVEEYRSQRVFVVGEVRTPGPQTLTGEMTLVEALSRAGSTLTTAGEEAIIVRPREGSATQAPIAAASLPTAGGGNEGAGAADRTNEVIANAEATHSEVIRVDIRDLQKGVIAQNVRLRDGDTVFIPRAPTVFVFGQVRNPGEYPMRSETTVLQALSLAGGVTDRGATGRIHVVRVVNGEKKDVDVRLTDIVRPGDTLVVPERFF